MNIRAFQSSRSILHNFTFNVLYNDYSTKAAAGAGIMGGALKKKKLTKMGPVMEKKELPVETDPERLVNYVCGSNIYKTGEDIKLKPDSEYPEWLWELRLGPPPPLETLDPNSKQYWRRIRKMAITRQRKILALRRF